MASVLRKGRSDEQRGEKAWAVRPEATNLFDYSPCRGDEGLLEGTGSTGSQERG